MPVLRDIVAKLSLDLDKKSFKEADTSIGSLTKRFAGLEGKIALAAAAFAAFKIVDFASDAQETLNVLEASFGDNTNAVKEWAAATGEAAGRSEYALREMAGTLGAVLNPMMDRNEEKAAKMSKRFSELAVDLGSFFNKTDKQALEALRSGLVGEAEPLKQFGVVMSVATLEAFALSKGIKKNMKDMTNAEKTALRYEFILEQTASAHGDAAKTADGFANASKGLGAAFKDVATRAGQVLLPATEKIVGMARDGLRAFNEYAKNSHILKAALIVLGAVAVKVAAAVVIAMLPILIPLLKLIAVVAVATIVLEDLISMFEGGESVIGDFIDAVFGPGSATEAVKNLKMAWEGMTLFWTNEVVPALRFLGAALVDSIKFWKELFVDMFAAIRSGIASFMDRFNAFVNFIKEKAQVVADFLGFELKFEEERQQSIDDDYKYDPARAREQRKQYEKRMAEYKRQNEKEERERKRARNKRGKGDKKADSRAAARRKKALNAKKKALAEARKLDRAAMQAQTRYFVNIQFAGARPTVAAPFHSSAGPATINQTVAVNVAGSASASDATTIADASASSVRRENQKTLAALVQRGS